MQRFSRGFTLIELLTVIAIIALLAGMTAAILPRVLERAKLSSLDNDFLQLRTGLIAYFTDHKDSFPPAYGFIKWESKDKQNLAVSDYHIEPFMAAIGMYNEPKLLDRFSDSFDGNRDGQISVLEFMPLGIKDPATEKITFRPGHGVYGIHNVDYSEYVGAMRNGGKRPFYYVPVNLAQYKKAREYFVRTNDLYARTWDVNNPIIAGLRFPPSKYDAFVLISVGPSGQTFGVIPDPIQAGAPKDIYHITALRAYFLATRDLDNNGQGNGKFDFDFRARTREGEAKLPGNELLPDNSAGAGPIIVKYP